ncbi:hypothetical protein QQ045_001755 [Rhodiola kirilowii]
MIIIHNRLRLALVRNTTAAAASTSFKTTLSPTPSPTPPTRIRSSHHHKRSESTSTTTPRSRSSISPDPIRQHRHLSTVFSGQEIDKLTEKTEQPKHKNRGKQRVYSKSLSELEVEEVRGFIELGFVFSEEDVEDTDLISIVPGIKRLGRLRKEDDLTNQQQQQQQPKPQRRRLYHSQTLLVRRLGRRRKKLYEYRAVEELENPISQ